MPKKPTKPAAKHLEASQRALIAEFTDIVQHMPAGKVRPLIELLTEIRRQNYANENLFEMIKAQTSIDAPDSYVKFADFLETMSHLTVIHAKHIKKAILRLREHGEKSMYRTIGYEIKNLKEGIRRGAASLAQPVTPHKARRAS